MHQGGIPMGDNRIVLHFSVLGAIVDMRTYKNLAYLLLSFPLGLAYFLFLIIGLSLGVGLTFILIGIPLLLFVLVTALALIEFERNLANVLLGTELLPAYSKTPNTSFADRAKALFTNLQSIKGLAFLLVKFPLGIISFVVSVVTIALTLGLFFAPLYYQSADISVDALGIGTVDTMAEAFLVSGIGLLSGVVTLPLTSLLAAMWHGLATLLLGGEADSAKHGRQTITMEKPKRNSEEGDFNVVHLAQPIGQESKYDRADADHEAIPHTTGYSIDRYELQAQMECEADSQV